jgi:glutaminase
LAHYLKKSSFLQSEVEEALYVYLKQRATEVHTEDNRSDWIGSLIDQYGNSKAGFELLKHIAQIRDLNIFSNQGGRSL